MNLEEMSNEEIETEALKQGFNPNYEGENKKTPKEFLEVAYSHNHVLKERNEKLSTQLDEIQAEMEKQRQITQKVVAFGEEQKKKAVEKAIKELNKEKKLAITEGDIERVEEIDKEIESHKEEPTSNPEFDTWVSKNPWYNTDIELGLEADVFARQYAETGRFKSNSELYQAVESKIKRTYPEKFQNPKKSEPSEVEVGRPSPTKKSKKSYEDLPPEARKACDEFVSEGIMKKEDYVNLYEWED